MWCLNEHLTICYHKNQIDVSLHASVLLLTMNFVVTLSKLLWIHSAIASWIHSYFDNVMMKFMINNRTDTWKTDVNLLICQFVNCSWACMHDDGSDDDDDDDGGHTAAKRLTDMQPWFIASFFDVGHPCYGQLTPVKTRYLLTSITWPYRRPKFRAHWGHVVFWSWPLTKCCFSIGSRAHVRLTLKSGPGSFGAG